MTTPHANARSHADPPGPSKALPWSPGACATLACLWEATAPKPGNVYRGADFKDLTYADFLTSAAVVGPILDRAPRQAVGETVLQAIRATRAAVRSNTNLGIVLLMAPLATVPPDLPLATGIASVLARLSVDDTCQVYEAIRVAQPGGLGEVPVADVQHPQSPEIPLGEAMQLAAHRDLVACQYVNDFHHVFLAAAHIEQSRQRGWALADAIVSAFLRLLEEFPDSLVARKCGGEVAQETSLRAAAVLASGSAGEADYRRSLQDFDFWLRSDGHRRNPGTTADLIAGGLFVLLREQRLDWPVEFSGRPEPDTGAPES